MLYGMARFVFLMLDCQIGRHIYINYHLFEVLLHSNAGDNLLELNNELPCTNSV